jgi:hypothetical protein
MLARNFRLLLHEALSDCTVRGATYSSECHRAPPMFSAGAALQCPTNAVIANENGQQEEHHCVGMIALLAFMR